MDRLAEIIGFDLHFVTYLRSSSRFKSVRVFFCVFIALSAERLARGNSLYQLFSNWFHRPWLYSNQEPTEYEANSLTSIH